MGTVLRIHRSVFAPSEGSLRFVRPGAFDVDVWRLSSTGHPRGLWRSDPGASLTLIELAGGGAGVSAVLPYLIYSVVPTVLREQGVRGLLSLDDHAPPHVHCFAGDGEIVVEPEPAVAVREEHGRLTVAERRRVLALVQARHGRLLRRWRRIHGR